MWQLVTAVQKSCNVSTMPAEYNGSSPARFFKAYSTNSVLQRSSMKAYTHRGVCGLLLWDTHTHTYTCRQTYTHGVALWWDIILSFSMLCYKMYLPCQSVSSNPSSVLVWCFPQGYTHRWGATHPGRWKEHGCHVINDSKNLSLPFSLVLTCTLALFLPLSHTYTPFRLAYKDTHQLPTETITQIFSLGATCTKMMTLPRSFCSLPLLLLWNGTNKWNARCPFPLPYSVKIILTQQYSFCLHDSFLSLLAPFFQFQLSNIL